MQITLPAADRPRKHLHPLQYLHLFAAGSLILITQVAHADYTVIDDDLLPTKMIQSRLPQQQPQSHHTIPFTKGYSQLTLPARDALNALLPIIMQGASIRIVGRSDAQRYARVASNRAKNIREYLVHQGIPDSSIISETDNTPNPQANGSIYASDLYITSTVTRAPSPYPAALEYFAPAPTTQSQAQNYAPRTYAPQIQQQHHQQRTAAPASTPLPSAYPGAPASAPMHTEQDQLLQYINQAVLSGQMEPAVAMKLLRTLFDAERNLPTQTAALQRAPSHLQSPMAQLALASSLSPAPLVAVTPTYARTQNWVLDKSMNLRDNIDAWSKQSGWNAVIWDASNLYQVTATTNLVGNFPGVLRQIADSTGLNICAKTREKYVRVTDSSVSCK